MYQVFNQKATAQFRKTLRSKATPQEVVLWSRLRRNSLGVKFRRQHAIGDYIVDFYCAEKKLAVEIDGWQHQVVQDYDAQRTAFFARLGIKVVRFWNNEVNDNLEGVLLKITASF